MLPASGQVCFLVPRFRPLFRVLNAIKPVRKLLLCLNTELGVVSAQFFIRVQYLMAATVYADSKPFAISATCINLACTCARNPRDPACKCNGEHFSRAFVAQVCMSRNRIVVFAGVVCIHGACNITTGHCDCLDFYGGSHCDIPPGLALPFFCPQLIKLLALQAACCSARTAVWFRRAGATAAIALVSSGSNLNLLCARQFLFHPCLFKLSLVFLFSRSQPRFGRAQRATTARSRA